MSWLNSIDNSSTSSTGSHPVSQENHSKVALCTQCGVPMKRLKAGVGEGVFHFCSPCDSVRQTPSRINHYYTRADRMYGDDRFLFLDDEDDRVAVTVKERSFIDRLLFAHSF